MVVALSRAILRSIYTEVLAASIHANLEGGRGSWVAGLDPTLTLLSSNPKGSPGQLVCSHSKIT